MAALFKLRDIFFGQKKERLVLQGLDTFTVAGVDINNLKHGITYIGDS